MKQEMYEHIQSVERTHWWYVARRKIVFDWLLDLLGRKKAPRTLDIGCGTGYNLERLRDAGYEHVVGIDLAADALRLCRSRGLEALVCGDGATPPFQSGTFDLVLALDLLEHLDDDVQALQEFARLLREGGHLIVFVPALPLLWGWQDMVSYHRRRYTAGELRTKMSAAGLKIVKLTYANMFLFLPILIGRLLLRLRGYRVHGVSENDLHPAWSNGLLQAIFAAERPLLRRANLPFGVSLLVIAEKG